MNAKAKKLAAVLAAKEARGPELALLRIVLGALGVKLGYDLEQFLH